MDLRMVSDADATLNGRAAAGAGAAAHATMDTSSSGSLGIVEQLSCSVVRSVEAHSKGGMSVLVAHPTAPLLATGTTSQVVKVWTDAGDVVSAIWVKITDMCVHTWATPCIRNCSTELTGGHLFSWSMVGCVCSE